MSTDPREFEHPIDGTTPNELPTVLGVGSLTPEAIEAAARALLAITPAEHLPYVAVPCWSDLHEADKVYYRRLATEALTAAAPFIAAKAKAEALREAAEVFGAGEWVDEFMTVTDDVSAVQATVNWLRARAATIESEAANA